MPAAAVVEKSPIGRSGLKVPRIGFGTSGLGSMPATYGYSVDEERARATVHAVLDGPAPFIDTSRNYGHGRSEERVGAVIRERGGLPKNAILSTKLDRDAEGGNRFDAAQVRRSLEASLKALGVDRVHLLHLHDPEYAADLSEVTGPRGAIAELFRMKEEGIAQAVGLAAGRVDIMMPMLRDFDFDALITHNRFTLANRNAVEMLDLAQRKGIAGPQRRALRRRRARQGNEQLPLLRLPGSLGQNARPDPPHRGGLREAQNPTRRRRAAVLNARPPNCRDHLRRHQARARARDAGMGRLADPGGGVDRTARATLWH